MSATFLRKAGGPGARLLADGLDRLMPARTPGVARDLPCATGAASPSLRVPGHAPACGPARPAAPLFERLWQKSEHRMTDLPLAGSRALVMGFDVEELPLLRTTLRDLGASPVVSCGSVKQLGDISGMKFNANLLLLNLDRFDDVEDGVDAMLSFRSRHPETIVVLASHRVAGDDLGAERRMICDATLRRPLTASRLRDGLLGAVANASLCGTA